MDFPLFRGLIGGGQVIVDDVRPGEAIVDSLRKDDFAVFMGMSQEVSRLEWVKFGHQEQVCAIEGGSHCEISRTHEKGPRGGGHGVGGLLCIQELNIASEASEF